MLASEVWQSLENIDGFWRERNSVALVILHPAARQRPKLVVEVEFGPCHCRHFIAALACKDQKPHQRPERPAEAVAGYSWFGTAGTAETGKSAFIRLEKCTNDSDRMAMTTEDCSNRERKGERERV